MKKIVFKGMAIMMLIVIASCAKLKENVYSTYTPEVYFVNSADARVALNGVYNTLNRQHVWTNDMFNLVFLPNKYVESRVPARKIYTSFSWSTTDASVLSVWTSIYTTIARANTIIDRVPEIDMTDALRGQYSGEAKFLRALSYFTLVRLFGGVPLKIHETVNTADVNAKRASVQDVYNLILADLKDAEANLPPTRTSAERGLATKPAAMALLGKVYLTMAGYPLKQTDKWDLARAKLKELIDNKATYGITLLPNFADIFSVTKESTNTEEIFAIQFSHITDQGSALPFFAAPLNSTFATAYGQYNYGFTTAFRNLYLTGDARKDVTLVSTYKTYTGATVTYGSDGTYKDPNGIALGKYQDGPPGTAATNVLHANDIILLRYADVLLMYAEAENEVNGPTTEAYTAINQVRSRAATTALSGLTKDLFREAVYKERLLELSGELHEFFDIQRLERLQDNMTNSPNAISAGVTYNAKCNYFPIPQSEIDVNTGIESSDQNPGY